MYFWNISSKINAFNDLAFGETGFSLFKRLEITSPTVPRGSL